MSRWHKASCRTPDVIVDGESPRCLTCNSSPLLKELIAQQAVVNNYQSPPADKPAGQMNLWWPPCVPYSNHLNSNQSSSANAAQEESNPGAEVVDLMTEYVDDVAPSIRLATEMYSPVYADELGLEEFRLVCFSAVDNNDYPVHATLEKYRHNDCPEYETVSYTWGGEDGDSTLCRPVYLGPYWDVLLQTRNCWSMLRYLRPRRGIRMVWVDAICINQNNVSERETQVASMGAIYQQCSRVVVYLGDDIVKASLRRHRPRKKLPRIDDQVQGGQINFPDLLNRKYFTRVWVIQELVLSPLAIFPIYDMDFLAGPLTFSLMDPSHHSGNRERTEAPWFRSIFDIHSFPGKDLYQALRQTWSSQATDPRDKIFGILGLVQHGQHSQVLKPNYSISLLDTFIGIFAHLLINLNHPMLLTNATGMAAPCSYPSWMPDWRNPWMLKDHYHKSFHYLKELRGMYVEDSGQFAGNIFAVSIYSNAENPDSEDYFEENAVEFEQMRSHEYAWNTHAFIDASTATLSITLTHLLQIKPIVTLSSQTEDRTTFSVQTKSCGLYICTEPISVDAIVHSESDHLFLLHSQDQETGLLFIMRQTATPRTFRLMLCCACYDVALFYKHLPGHPHYNVPEYMYNKKYAGSYSVMLHGSLYTALEQARTLSNLEFGPKETCRRELDFLREMFPGKTFTIMDILPTIQGLLNKATGLSPGFQEAYSRQLIETLPAYHPYVKDDFVELRFDPEQWTSVHDCFSSSKALTRWRWRHDSHAPWSNDRFSMVDTSRPVYLRGNLRYIYKSFLYGSIFDIMLRVRSFSHITLEDEITMIKRGPKVEDKLVFDDAWPRVAVEELGLDGTPWQVNIS